MIRQRNIDPVSSLGMWIFASPFTVSAAAVGAAIGKSIPLVGVDKVQLIDLTVLVDVAIAGGGTLSFDVRKTASNVSGSTQGTLVKAASTGVSAVGQYVTDLTNVAPIDPRGLLAATPNNFNLQVGWVNSATVTTVTFGFILRFRPFFLKDA